MSAYQRNKGARGELEAAKLLRRVFPDADRKVSNDRKRENGVDLVNTGALRVQVKRGKRPAPVSKLDEVRDPTGIPVLMTRGDRGEWLIVLKANDFIDILADVAEAYET